MNISWLREFIVLAGCCNYLEAAERLFISQSTLSKHIKALEDELGLFLFDRSTRKVQLSRAGEILVPYARNITQAGYAFEAAARNYKETMNGRVVIDSIPTLPQYGITDIVSSFQKSYPHYRITMLADQLRNPEEDLRNGICELAFIRRLQNYHQSEEFEEYSFFPKDHMVAVLPPSHPLADQPFIRLEQLQSDTFIALEEDSMLHDLFLAACQRIGFFPHISFTCNQVGSILNLIAQGVGVSLLMHGHTIHPNADSFPEHQSFIVKPLIPTVYTSINLCYLKNRPLSAAAQAFYNCVTAYCSKTLNSDITDIQQI